MSGLSLYQAVCQGCGVVSLRGVPGECGSAIVAATNRKEPYLQVSVNDHSRHTAVLWRQEVLS